MNRKPYFVRTTDGRCITIHARSAAEAATIHARATTNPPITVLRVSGRPYGPGEWRAYHPRTTFRLAPTPAGEPFRVERAPMEAM